MIEKVLQEREKTYGEYWLLATASQDLKIHLRANKNWRTMPSYMRESLEMIAHKLARITIGDYTHLDSWVDIVGYAMLVVKELEKEKAKEDGVPF